MLDKINTYPEMNKQIKYILRSNGENYELYAVQRIEELETDVDRLERENVGLRCCGNCKFDRNECIDCFPYLSNWQKEGE